MSPTINLPRLQTQRLLLRPLEVDDAPQIVKLAGDRRVAATTLNIPHPYGMDIAEDFIYAVRHDMQKKRGYVFAITKQRENKLLGCIGLTLQRIHMSAELGYWLGVPYWGKGYTTEAAKRLVDFGFEDLELNRIFAVWFTDNPASGRVLEKCGMKHEGVLRQHLMKWGEFKDAAHCGMLRTEWESYVQNT